MREDPAAFDDPKRDPRLRCILCESLLPVQTVRAIAQEPDAICVRCWALTPDDRRLLRDRAMARIVRGDYAH